MDGRIVSENTQFSLSYLICGCSAYVLTNVYIHALHMPLTAQSIQFSCRILANDREDFSFVPLLVFINHSTSYHRYVHTIDNKSFIITMVKPSTVKLC